HDACSRRYWYGTDSAPATDHPFGGDDVRQRPAGEVPGDSGAQDAGSESAKSVESGNAAGAEECDLPHLRADLLLHFRVGARESNAHVGTRVAGGVSVWLGPGLPGIE